MGALEVRYSAVRPPWHYEWRSETGVQTRVRGERNTSHKERGKMLGELLTLLFRPVALLFRLFTGRRRPGPGRAGRDKTLLPIGGMEAAAV